MNAGSIAQGPFPPLPPPGQPLTGILDYQLEGTLVLEAAVGCGADCGPRGVCGVQEAAASNSSSQQQPTPGPECLCQCGWTGVLRRWHGAATAVRP